MDAIDVFLSNGVGIRPCVNVMFHYGGTKA